MNWGVKFKEFQLLNFAWNNERRFLEVSTILTKKCVKVMEMERKRNIVLPIEQIDIYLHSLIPAIPKKRARYQS